MLIILFVFDHIEVRETQWAGRRAKLARGGWSGRTREGQGKKGRDKGRREGTREGKREGTREGKRERAKNGQPLAS